MKWVVAAALCLSLSACMTSSPSRFDPPPAARHFEFTGDVLVANKVSSGLAAGRYVAAFASDTHVFYLGPPKALIMANGTRVNGGIALPKTAGDTSCYLFIQIGDDSQQVREQGMGVVAAQVAKLEAGSIREFRNDPMCQGFLPRIQLVDG